MELVYWISKHAMAFSMIIAYLFRCDGIDDCHDDSDEKHYSNECPRYNDEHDCNLCFEGYFACDNKKCIRELWICDKDDDCGDNSDEKNCDDNKKMITKSDKCDEFKCSADTCLPYSKVCDGNRNCPYGSDENVHLTFIKRTLSI
ncbi:Vitellogenin receptor [Temnothorax longispinosus]|uniref:Vitellogenin receptor n=1 Tax=Temnothorax longispinosus TaxID=300112 RepID=A0A4S2JDQ8_9HYME|nr:Vitellogenin receptor [Temnothorax longispinosus]